MPGEPPSQFKFPGPVSLRVIGRQSDDFEQIVHAAIAKHGSTIEPGATQVRASREGAYLSLAVTFYAENRAQLEAIYRELNALEQVKLVL